MAAGSALAVLVVAAVAAVADSEPLWHVRGQCFQQGWSIYGAAAASPINRPSVCYLGARLLASRLAALR